VEKNYSVSIQCRNCGIEKTFLVPLGMTVRDYARTKKCDKCGCHIDGSDQIIKRTKYACKSK